MDSIRIETARNGLTTARRGERYVHSAYDPGREAARFLDARIQDIPEASTVVILGAGLGYLDRRLGEERPSCRIIAVHLDSILFEHALGSPGTEGSSASRGKVLRWHPGQGDIESFLYTVIQETAIPGLRVIEWPGACDALPETARAVRSALAAVVRRHTGNISATAAFGRLWIRNAFRNFLETDDVAVHRPGTEAVVLAASGPSLESVLPTLRRCRRSYRLWALPSSLAALGRASLRPDLVFMTDSGLWARLHGRYLDSGIPVAMPLSAAPLPRGCGPRVLLTQGTPGEDELLATGAWPVLGIEATGTVAAAAVTAWKSGPPRPMFLAGLDLGWTDLRSHVRPHSFDGWLAALSGRLAPAHHVAWTRARLQAPRRSKSRRVGGALETYADWFRRTEYPAPIFRLLGDRDESDRVDIGIPDAEAGALESYLPRAGRPTSVDVRPAPIDRDARRAAIRQLVNRWRRSLAESEDAVPGIGDLAYALDPGGILEIRRSAGRDRDAARARHRDTLAAALAGLEPRDA